MDFLDAQGCVIDTYSNVQDVVEWIKEDNHKYFVKFVKPQDLQYFISCGLYMPMARVDENGLHLSPLECAIQHDRLEFAKELIKCLNPQDIIYFYGQVNKNIAEMIQMVFKACQDSNHLYQIEQCLRYYKTSITVDLFCEFYEFFMSRYVTYITDPNFHQYAINSGLRPTCAWWKNVYSNRELCHLYIKNGFDIDDRDKNGSTILHVISKYDATITLDLFDITKLVNVQDNDGNTPAHLLDYDNMKLLDLLIQNGFNPLIKNKTGQYFSPLMEHPHILKFLSSF